MQGSARGLQGCGVSFTQEVQWWCRCRCAQSSECSRTPLLPQALQTKGQQGDARYLCLHLLIAIKVACLALQSVSLIYCKGEILKHKPESS